MFSDFHYRSNAPTLAEIRAKRQRQRFAGPASGSGVSCLIRSSQDGDSGNSGGARERWMERSWLPLRQPQDSARTCSTLLKAHVISASLLVFSRH